MDAKQQVQAAVRDKEAAIWELQKAVWSAAELGYEEVKSAASFCQALREQGFEVESGVAGIPTAFIGTYGSGKPVIGILAEFDALSQLGQAAANPVKTPVPENENGHGCGHSALGAGAFGAVLAVKDYLEKTGKSGTVKLYGCPAEETGYGKTFMTRAGCFEGVDAVLTWHPFDNNAAWGVSCLANINIVFNFHGRTAHAAAAPHAGRSALDSCEIMNVGVNYLREHVIPEARMHYAYLDVGGTSPNVVQDHATLSYFIRAPKISQVHEILERVKDIAKGAALICGTTMDWYIRTGVSDYIPNPTLTGILYDALVDVGAPDFDEADFALARQFRDSLGEDLRQASDAAILKSRGEEHGKKLLAQGLDTDIAPLVLSKVAMPGSTDVGDVSYVVPTAQMGTAGMAIGTPGHTWQITGQTCSSIGKKALLKASEALALAAARVLDDPSVLEKAKAELKEETGGQYVCPIPAEVEPPVPDWVFDEAKKAGLL